MINLLSDKPVKPLSLEQQMELVKECIYFERFDKFIYQYHILIVSTHINYWKYCNINYDKDKVWEFFVDVIIFFMENDYEYLRKWLERWKEKLSGRNVNIKAVVLPSWVKMHALFIVRNALRSVKLDDEVYEEENISESNLSNLSVLPGKNLDLNTDIEKREMIKIILSHTSELTSLERLIFKLHSFYYFEKGDIAKMVHRDKNTIFQRIHTAEKKLKAIVDKLFL
ncbi:hypothetical protein MHK_009450 [Candidatus Magnetomorum sp. HK-1]|nr:hypothetical protein MHK_009450 [Candidatus Magnetomorum sp. HK-1]